MVLRDRDRSVWRQPSRTVLRSDACGCCDLVDRGHGDYGKRQRGSRLLHRHTPAGTQARPVVSGVVARSFVWFASVARSGRLFVGRSAFWLANDHIAFPAAIGSGRKLTEGDAFMWIVKLALARPYTFILFSLVLLLISPVVLLRTPIDIFPS